MATQVDLYFPDDEVLEKDSGSNFKDFRSACFQAKADDTLISVFPTEEELDELREIITEEVVTFKSWHNVDCLVIQGEMNKTSNYLDGRAIIICPGNFLFTGNFVSNKPVKKYCMIDVDSNKAHTLETNSETPEFLFPTMQLNRRYCPDSKFRKCYNNI